LKRRIRSLSLSLSLSLDLATLALIQITTRTPRVRIANNARTVLYALPIALALALTRRDGDKAWALIERVQISGVFFNIDRRGRGVCLLLKRFWRLRSIHLPTHPLVMLALRTPRNRGVYDARTGVDTSLVALALALAEVDSDEADFAALGARDVMNRDRFCGSGSRGTDILAIFKVEGAGRESIGCGSGTDVLALLEIEGAGWERRVSGLSSSSRGCRSDSRLKGMSDETVTTSSGVVSR
jgi:hypothetical protein